MEHNTLTVRKYPKLVQDFATENFNLKALSAALLGLLFILLVLVIYFVKKGPEVIALDGSGEIARLEIKTTDAQIQRAAEQYLSYRYKWSPESINTQLRKAEYFIDPTLVGSFQKSMIEVQKYVKEKKVTQRVYPSSVQVDLKEKKITILADRITEFDNLNAATKMKVILDFTTGDRTPLNPWGIYIRKEAEGESR